MIFVRSQAKFNGKKHLEKVSPQAANMKLIQKVKAIAQLYHSSILKNKDLRLNKCHNRKISKKNQSISKITALHCEHKNKE
jgi:hypothetical protein